MDVNTVFINETPKRGFLCDFVVSSSDKPDDGLNGECTFHYMGAHKNCELVVTIVDGKKEGKAFMLKDDVPWLKLYFSNNELTGAVERMDDFGLVKMRGNLVKGIEHGLFEEYDNADKVIWRGYYENGKPYSAITESETLTGFYDERSVASGSLLSIAQYDESLHDKTGQCFEFENGSLRRECTYENGVRHIVREFRDDKMTVYDKTGEKVYEGMWFGDLKSGFLCHEPVKGMTGFYMRNHTENKWVTVSEYDELNVYRNGKCFELINGMVKRVCIYKMGQFVRLLMEFNGKSMTEYDRDGKKQYIGGYCGEMKSGFLRNGRGAELDKEGDVKRVCFYVNGMMRRVIQLFSGDTVTEFDNMGKRVYEGHFKGDVENGFVRDGQGYCLNDNGLQMCLYENGQMIHLVQDVVDEVMREYDANGKMTYYGGYMRLEGGDFVRNGRGYCMNENGTVTQLCTFEQGKVKSINQEFDGNTMTEYDENGRKQYVGEYRGDTKVGFVREGKGKEYRNGTKAVAYSGEWKNGKRDGLGTEFNGFVPFYTGGWRNGVRNGNGKEMDENGNVVKNGLWWNGVFESEFTAIPSSMMVHQLETEEIVIGNNSYNDVSVTELKLWNLDRLKSIRIGSASFKNVRLFQIDGLRELKSVVIAENSFTLCSSNRDLIRSTRTDGTFQVTNCPQLTSLCVIDSSFSDYHSFELKSLPSLQSIEIGTYCFTSAPQFSLQSGACLGQ